MFDWAEVPKEIPPEELEKALLNSRMVDKVVKQLRCNRLDVADRIERMVGELESNKITLASYQILW